MEKVTVVILNLIFFKMKKDSLRQQGAKNHTKSRIDIA